MVTTKRIPYGKEQGPFKGWGERGDKCPDCGVSPGQYHKEYCDIEECPACHIGQYGGCSCQESAEEAQIRVIETRTRQHVDSILSRAGIVRGSQRLSDYNKAKKLLFGGLWIDSDIYDKQIGWLLEYLNMAGR